MATSSTTASPYGDSGSLNMMGLLKLHQRQLFGTNTKDVPAVPNTASDYLNECIPKPVPRDPLHFRPSTANPTTTTSNNRQHYHPFFADITTQSASQRNAGTGGVINGNGGNNNNTTSNTLRDSWCDPARLLPSSIAMAPDLYGNNLRNMYEDKDKEEETPEELVARLEEERNSFLPANHPLRYSGHLPTTPPSTPSLHQSEAAPSAADGGIQNDMKRRTATDNQQNKPYRTQRQAHTHKETGVEHDDYDKDRWASSRAAATRKPVDDDGVPFHLKVQELESRFRDQMEVHRGLDNAMTQIDLVTKQERARRAAERTAEMSAKVAQEIKERQELQCKMAASRQAHLANHVEQQEAATLRHMYGGGQMGSTAASARPGTAPVASSKTNTTAKTTTTSSSTITTAKPSATTTTTTKTSSKKSSKDAGSSPAPVAALHPAVSATQGGISADSRPYRRVRLVAVPDDSPPPISSSPSATNKSGASSPASPHSPAVGGGGLSRPPPRDTDMVAQSIDTAITSSMLSSSFQASVLGEEDYVTGSKPRSGGGGLSKPPVGKSQKSSKKSSKNVKVNVKFEKGTRYGSSDSDTTTSPSSSGSIRSMSYTDNSSMIYSDGGSYYSSNSSSRITSDDDDSIDDGVYDDFPRGGGRGRGGRHMVPAGGGGKVSVREVMEMLGGLVGELDSKQSAHEERVKSTLQRLQVHTQEKQEDHERRLLEQLKAVSKELEENATPDDADDQRQQKTKDGGGAADPSAMPPAANLDPAASINTPITTTTTPTAVINTDEPKPAAFPFKNSLGPRPSLSSTAAAPAVPAATHKPSKSLESSTTAKVQDDPHTVADTAATNLEREAALETARRLIARSMAHEEEKRVQEHLAALLKARTEQSLLAEKEAQRQEMIGKDPVLHRINDDIGTLKAFMGRLQDHMVVVTERKRMEAVRRGMIVHSQKLVAQRDAILRGEFAAVHPHNARAITSSRGRGGGLSSRGRGGAGMRATGGGLSTRGRGGGGLSARPNQQHRGGYDEDEIEDEVDDGFPGGRGPTGLSRPPPRNNNNNYGDDVIDDGDEIGYDDEFDDDGFEDFVLGAIRDNMGGVYTDDDIIDEVDDDGGDDEYYYGGGGGAGGGRKPTRHNNNNDDIYEDSIEEYDDGLVVDEFDTPARKKQQRPTSNNYYQDNDDIIDDISDPQSGDDDDDDDFYIPRVGTKKVNNAVNDSVQEEIVKEDDSIEYGDESFENSDSSSNSSSSPRNNKKKQQQVGTAVISSADAEADALFFRPAEIKLIAKLITAGGSGRGQGKTAKRVGMSATQLSKKEEDLVVRLLRQSEAEQAAIDAEGPGAEFERQRQLMKDALTRAQIKTANHKKKRRGRDSNQGSSSDWSSSSTSSTGKASSLFFRQELEDTSSSHASDTSSVRRHRARRQNLKRTCLSHLYLQRERHDKRYNRKDSKHLLIESPSPVRDAARKRQMSSSSHLSRTTSSPSSSRSKSSRGRTSRTTSSSRSSSPTSSRGTDAVSKQPSSTKVNAAELAAQRRREAFLKRGAAANLKSPSIDSVEDVESVGSSTPPSPPQRSPRRRRSNSSSPYSTRTASSGSASSSSYSRRPSSSIARTTTTTTDVNHGGAPSTAATISTTTTTNQQYVRVKSPVSNLIQYKADGTIDFMNTDIPSTNERRRQRRREKRLLREQGIVVDEEGRGGGVVGSSKRLFEPRGHFADVEENSSSATPHQRRRAKIVLSSAEHTPSSHDLDDERHHQPDQGNNNDTKPELFPKNNGDGSEDGEGDRSALRDAIDLHKRARRAKNATEAMTIIEEQERRAHARLVKQRQIVAKHEVKFQMFDRNNKKNRSDLDGEEDMESDDSEAWARIQRERIKREISSSSRRRIVDSDDDNNREESKMKNKKKSMSSPRPFSYFYGDRPWKNSGTEEESGGGDLLLLAPHDGGDMQGDSTGSHSSTSNSDKGTVPPSPAKSNKVPPAPLKNIAKTTQPSTVSSSSPHPSLLVQKKTIKNSRENGSSMSSSSTSTSPDGSHSDDAHSTTTNDNNGSHSDDAHSTATNDNNVAPPSSDGSSPNSPHHRGGPVVARTTASSNKQSSSLGQHQQADDNSNGVVDESQQHRIPSNNYVVNEDNHDDDEASHYSSSICSVLEHLVPPLPPALPEEDWRQARTRQPSPENNNNNEDGDDASASNSSNSETYVSVQTVPLTEAQRQRKLAEERRELAVELATMDTWKERQKRRFSSVYSSNNGRSGGIVQDDEVPPPPPPFEEDEDNNNHHIAVTSTNTTTNPWAGFEAMLFSRFGPTAADEEALHGAAAIRQAREKLEAMRHAGIDISNSEGDDDDSSPKKASASSKPPPNQDGHGNGGGDVASSDDDGDAGMMDYSNTSEDASNDDYYDRVLRHKQHPTLATRKEDLIRQQQELEQQEAAASRERRRLEEEARELEAMNKRNALEESEDEATSSESENVAEGEVNEDKHTTSVTASNHDDGGNEEGSAYESDFVEEEEYDEDDYEDSDAF